MSNEATIPSSQPKSVATFKVLSGGAQIPGTWHVLSIVVNKEVNRVPTATIILIDGDPAAQSFEVSNAAEFEPGKEIEIQFQKIHNN